MGQPIDKITLKGFKSIRSLEDFALRPLNILIGANGAGKSNFVSFFMFLRELVEGRLRLYVEMKGGADDHLFMGPKVTSQICAYLHSRPVGYGFSLKSTSDNTFVFSDERITLDFIDGGIREDSIGKGHRESVLKEQCKRTDDPYVLVSRNICDSILSWVTYHFHDTSDVAPMRRSCSVRDYEYLRPDAANLATYLLYLDQKHAGVYDKIIDTIRLAVPFFNDFVFRPKLTGDDAILQLEWTQKTSDYPFHVSQLSDGTLRFIALTTALLQPNPPATILLDEPELGLHPYALTLLAELLKKATEKTQVIVSTQSASLLDNFEAEDIVVVERENGASTFKRLSSSELAEWLKDYSLGELWQKNVIGGRPSNG